VTGPAPLQTKLAVACGDAGLCLQPSRLEQLLRRRRSRRRRRHLQGRTQTVCDVQVPPLSSWTPVFVRQNNDPAILYLLWNSGKPGAVISGYVLDKDQQGVQGATVSANGAGGGSSPVDGTTGFYAINVKAGQYSVAPPGVRADNASWFDPESLSLSVEAGAWRVPTSRSTAA